MLVYSFLIKTYKFMNIFIKIISLSNIHKLLQQTYFGNILLERRNYLIVKIHEQSFLFFRFFASLFDHKYIYNLRYICKMYCQELF